MSDDVLPGLALETLDRDPDRDEAVNALRAADPDGERAAEVFRNTFDQLYDGQHTGRYRWEQLFKTEKTHYGTLLEINLRREFDGVIDDGQLLDYRVLGHEIDCKFSQTMGGWMLPPECFGHLLLVATASDVGGTWSIGVVRASDVNRRTSQNRDGKTSLNAKGRGQIDWVHFEADLPPNVLLGIDQATVGRIFAPKSGQKRINELLRSVTNMRVGRNTIAAVAKQSDYMARVRDNGNGARTTLRAEGYLIPGGDYDAHRTVARQLGANLPGPGEVVSLRVALADPGDSWTVQLDGQRWRLAADNEPVVESAPKLPSTKKSIRGPANRGL